MNKYKYWQENKMKIINYLANGHSKSELINFLGISKSTFYKWTKRNFIVSPKKRNYDILHFQCHNFNYNILAGKIINYGFMNFNNCNFNIQYSIIKIINFGEINFNNCNFDFAYYASEFINSGTININNCNFKAENHDSDKIKQVLHFIYKD